MSKNDKDFELSPILIGSTLAQNAISIYDVDNDSMYSIDGLRFELSINPDDFEAVSLALDTFGNPQFFSGSNRIGTYRYFWTWREDEFTVALGFGLNGTGKCNIGKGFLDYNPNKVPDDFICRLYRCIDHFANSRLVRWDLAIDFPLVRDAVRMIKDMAKVMEMKETDVIRLMLYTFKEWNIDKSINKARATHKNFDRLSGAIKLIMKANREQRMSNDIKANLYIVN